MAGTGTRLGWIVLSALAAQPGLASDEADAANVALPGRELLLYLAEFEGADDESIDPLELEALPVSSSTHPAARSTPAVRSKAPLNGPASTKEERRDETE